MNNLLTMLVLFLINIQKQSCFVIAISYNICMYNNFNAIWKYFYTDRKGYRYEDSELIGFICERVLLALFLIHLKRNQYDCTIVIFRIIE